MWTLLLLSATADASRAKDIGDFAGRPVETLVGIGVVSGLAGTGDSTRNVASQTAFLAEAQSLGMPITPEMFSSRNLALVQVTAEMGPDHRRGQALDVTISSVGDAKSLEGGVLGETLLNGLDGQTYAVASGSVSIGGFGASAGGDSTRKNHLTVGYSPDAARVVVEFDWGVDYNTLTTVDFILDEEDWTSVIRFAETVNEAFGQDIALPVSASTVQLTIPEDYVGRFGWFAAEIESLDVPLDRRAVVVINERTGTVVMGSEVRIAPVAVAHGGLMIEVDQQVTVSQPASLSLGGNTEVVANTEVDAAQEDGELQVVAGSTIGELVTTLNALGVQPRDLITILQMIEAAGAMDAELRLQ